MGWGLLSVSCDLLCASFFRLNADVSRSFTMKAMSMILFAVSSLCIFCVESTLEFEFAGAAKLSVHSLLAAGGRYKRQDTQEKCTSKDRELHRDVVNAWCNPNDLNEPAGQHYLKVFVECNRINGTTRVSLCSRDENQQFCDLNRDVSTLLHAVRENCPRQMEYSRYQCTNSCIISMAERPHVPLIPTSNCHFSLVHTQPSWMSATFPKKEVPAGFE